MDPLPELSRIERLETDIDFRLADLWELLDDSDEMTLKQVASFIRAAYGRGYTDALKEPSGKLYRDHGYRLPKPQED